MVRGEDEREDDEAAGALLERLLVDARAGVFDKLVVFKLDRLARSGVRDTFAVVGALRDAGIVLHAVADNLVIKPGEEDITSTVMVFALGLAARLERVAINERIAAARVRKEAAGGTWGRTPRMTPALATTARRRAQGRSIRDITQAIKIPRAVVGRFFCPTPGDAPDTTADQTR